MQVYTELVAPSAVTHSLSLPLTSAAANNLVVAKGSLLQVFETRTIAAELDPQQYQPENQPSGKGDPKQQQNPDFDVRGHDDDGLEALLLPRDRAQHTKLVLVAEIPVAGTVIGLARLKLRDTASGGEALLLAYRGAKMCLTEWNPQRLALDTVSIHYYEKDELQGAPWELPFGEYVNYIEADPASRCAAFKFGSRNLSILPFRQAEEDLEMEDWDEALDGPKPVKEASLATNENGHGTETQYLPSFVLRLPLLDPTLLHPVHLSFLHQYREPTFGILSSAQSTSIALGLRDHMTYKVFTLDLKQRASTTILSVTGLPQDLKRVLPLPNPVGGALLVGENELIHIDQSGKANGVAVNPMARQMTSFSLADQSQLNYRLEGCAIEPISMETGELLLILNDASLSIISFKIDGRTVSGISLVPVSPENGGSILKSRVSCISRIGKSSMFIGSESGDSVVLGWSRKQPQEKRKKSRALDADLALDVEDIDLDDDFDEDDDLYGTESAAAKPSQAANGAVKGGEPVFRIQDSLLCLAPIHDVAPGKAVFPPDSEEAVLRDGVTSELQLACAVGRGKAGAIAILNREIQPKVIGRFEFPEARGFWTMCVKKPVPKALGSSAVVSSEYDSMELYDRFMIVAKVDLDGYETSDVYALTDAGFESLKDTEFEPAAGFTVMAGTMGKQMRIIQVLKSEVRCYDGDLGLSQILPMMDEETGAEPRVVSASIADPYLTIIRDDHSVFIAKIGSNDELEEVEKDKSPLTSIKWQTGCLYADHDGIFQPKQPEEGDDSRVMLFLMSTAGALHMYDLNNLSEPVYVAEGLTSTPPFLSANFTGRKAAAKETLTEILVADLGDVVAKSPYLILRHDTDDLTLYEPVRYHEPNSASAPLSDTLFFKKSTNSTIAKSAPASGKDDDDTEQRRFVPLQPCANVGGYSTVFLSGDSPSFILKSAKSIPRIVGLQGQGVRGMSTFNTEGCDRGFIYADTKGIARVSQLPTDTNYAELGISVKKIPLDCDVNRVSFHSHTATYIAACSTSEPFELPRDDDYHKEWAKETVTFAPTMPRGILKLISPAAWTVIHSLDLESCETIESMMALHLEISEETKERRMVVAVGSAICKGEDLPTRGRVQVFDIVTVIPEPGRPETNKRLKLQAKEELPRGGVTSLSEIGTSGLLLIAQGQKCMVRGLREDGGLLPVAFLDMNCHILGVRELRGTGLCLMADAFKGMWFAGYTEEPYTFKVLGKSSGQIPMLVADFLPDGEDLSMIGVDADGDLHVFEFNPDRMYHLLFLLHPPGPSAPAPDDVLAPQPMGTTGAETPHTLLLSCPTGQLAALTPLGESAYRRLLSLANQLMPTVTPHGGLHPKAHRLPEGRGAQSHARAVGVETAAASGRMIVDGTVLTRWTELGAAKRAEMAAKSGYDDLAELRAELEGVLGWSGMAYF
ncbi:protein CFT1 [Cordyceps fumosorosea ARSEF 2679]|uniref:Protein CFT1 n=1 Tax=Cordyceps fumosorosea (strain ARSEF 2679) TaxID=1081104 RepID=A0A167V6Q0_CORFA|nr:protein CFT1 [Cordyceps fumosorosea ARSEF 2679]OAA62286.1 protein CFT1 [Cordyceps fumosorosea ARSEF 2679]